MVCSVSFTHMVILSIDKYSTDAIKGDNIVLSKLTHG
jgi:hypothetical protein